MTVKEAIRLLEECPEDFDLVDNDGMEVKRVRIVDFSTYSLSPTFGPITERRKQVWLVVSD
jgi:hypothetical protein